MSVPPASKPLATNPRAVVIGAGVAGLAAACLMAKDYDVTVLEKNPESGGRVGRLRDGGFLWDTGPSWLLMPDAYKRFYQRMGTTMEAELDLIRLDPAYRVFHEGFDPVDVRSGIPEVRALFDALSPGDGEKVTAYLDSATDTYRMAVKMFLYTTFSSVRPFLTRAMLGRLGTLQRLLMTSLKRHVERNFSHPIAQKILQYPAVLLATSPADTPAMYHLLSHADLVEGVYYPRGGFGTVVDSLERLALGQGVELRFGYEARAITSTPVDAKETRHKATGVRVCQVNSDKGGVKETEVLPADVVIAAGDMYHTDTQLLPSKLRSHPERHWRHTKPGIGVVVAMLGVRGHLPQLTHHQLILSSEWEEDFDAIFNSPHGSSHSIYVCKPSETDAEIAPEGHENLFILIPTSASTDIGHGSTYNDEPTPKVEMLVDAAIQLISDRCGIPDLEERVVARHTLGPADFAQRYFAWHGTALGYAHTLRQSAFLRGNQASKTVEGLFYAGSTTTPGVGVPMCLISAENAASLAADYLA